MLLPTERFVIKHTYQGNNRTITIIEKQRLLAVN